MNSYTLINWRINRKWTILRSVSSPKTQPREMKNMIKPVTGTGTESVT